MTFEFKSKIRRNIALLALVFGLAACGGGGGGGGGGGSTPAPPNPGPPLPSRANYALQTSVAAPTYADARKTALFTRLNAVRMAMGVGQLRQNAALDAAAQGHAEYLARNLLPPTHTQEPSRPGFTGATVQDRIQAAGYASVYASEGIGGMPTGHPVADYGAFVDAFMNTVYHGDTMSGPYRDVGIGVAGSVRGDYVVINYGAEQYPQLADAGEVLHYPYSGQSGVATSFNPDAESPRPLPSVAGPWGPSIKVSLLNFAEATAPNASAADVTITKAQLKDANGNLVATRVVARSGTRAGTGVVLTTDPNEAYLEQLSYYLLPAAPLTPNHAYSVSFEATGRGGSYAKTWSFTTGN